MENESVPSPTQPARFELSDTEATLVPSIIAIMFVPEAESCSWCQAEPLNDAPTEPLAMIEDPDEMFQAPM